MTMEREVCRYQNRNSNVINNDEWPRLTISLPWIVIWFAFNKNNQITNACSINHDYIHA